MPFRRGLEEDPVTPGAGARRRGGSHEARLLAPLRGHHRTVTKETDECMALADIGTHANQTNPRFRASPGINVAFPDLVSEGDVWLQALVELNHRQLSLGGPSFHGDDHV